MSLHEYLLVLDPEFLIQKYYIWKPLQTDPEVRRHTEIEREKKLEMFRKIGRNKIVYWGFFGQHVLDPAFSIHYNRESGVRLYFV